LQPLSSLTWLTVQTAVIPPCSAHRGTSIPP
jgi:hypothetical protein